MGQKISGLRNDSGGDEFMADLSLVESFSDWRVNPERMEKASKPQERERETSRSSFKDCLNSEQDAVTDIGMGMVYPFVSLLVCARI